MTTFINNINSKQLTDAKVAINQSLNQKLAEKIAIKKANISKTFLKGK